MCMGLLALSGPCGGRKEGPASAEAVELAKRVGICHFQFHYPVRLYKDEVEFRGGASYAENGVNSLV